MIKLKKALDAIPAKTTKLVKLKAEVAKAISNLAAVKAKIAEIEDKTITITTRHVTGRAGGGLAGHPGAGLFRGVGTTTSDSNLVALSDWEYVINAARTKMTRPWLDFINFAPESAVRAAMGNIQGLAGGGIVQNIQMPQLVPVAAGPASGSSRRVDVFVNGKEIDPGGDRGSLADALVTELKDLSRGVLL